ncbi:macrophage mannose receptor 1-like isoform X4 [Embiotoca jacksoni]|uniref:macrophage mannose receptor 1-like isoform X4 n=1 Tax=Embiotoca jacksoni TaxID=100190 RepID=UPI00370388E7
MISSTRPKMKWSLFLITLMGQCCFITGQVYSYHYVNMNETWSDAQNYCRQKHTDLATVNNMRDMKRLLRKRPVNKEEAWIGLKKHTDANRTWHWSLPWVEYKENKEKWTVGEPDNQIDVENCVKLHNRKWQDVRCSRELKFVCYNGKNASKEFFPINEEKTWLEAQRYCRKHHTDLISGVWQLNKSRDENVTVSNDHFWIGLFRDTWRWSDGFGSYFRHWDVEFEDQPENCAKIMLDEDGLWRNGNCTEKKPFFCYEERTTVTWSPSLTEPSRDGSRRKPRTPRLLSSGWDCATPARWISGSGSATRWSATKTGTQRKPMNATCLEP